MKAIATVSLYDMGAANRNALRHSLPELTAHPTLTSSIKFMNLYPFNDIQAISPRLTLFIAGENSHSIEFSEDAYKLAAEPKERYIVPDVGHVDLYDWVNMIPFDKLTFFFEKYLISCDG